jgi:3-hydroxyacyl-[acyl-carrier-protein] dehydratase
MAESVQNIPVERIMEMIPHRYPLLLIDRILEVTPDVEATGLKNVSMNEPIFTGHFPTNPVYPGVLIIESMAQTSAALVVHTLGKNAEGKLVYFMSIEEAKFRKPVVPGDQLIIHVKKLQARRNVWKVGCEARVDGTKVAEATVTAMILDE